MFVREIRKTERVTRQKNVTTEEEPMPALVLTATVFAAHVSTFFAASLKVF